VLFRSKRPGGTIFSVKNYEEDKEDNYENFRQLKAICGVIIDPCNLNITLNVGHYESIENIINKENDIIKKIKNEIIDYKNKLLFGYVETNQAINDFNQLKQELSFEMSYYESVINLYYSVVDNKNKNEKLNTTLEKSYILINNIKQSITKFNETNNTQFIKDAVNIYVNELKPDLNTIMDLKYKDKAVVYDSETNTYNLIEKKNTFEDFEFNSQKFEVVNYDIGLRKEKEKEKEKQQVNISIREEEEYGDNPINIEFNTEANTEINTIEYTLNDDGTITWNNPENELLWNSFNQTLKDALLKDKEWLTDFMVNCLKNKKQNLPCTFVAPTNLIIPPQILSDGEYDFGNVTYNLFFNSQTASEQEAILSLFTQNNDGTKDYKMMEEKLANEISKNLGLS
jgi:hypothetical protein